VEAARRVIGSRPVDDDLAALERWRAGDARAGEALCARHFDEIYRFFDHKLAGEADDLTQQTFLACVQGREAFRGEASFRTYLFSIARNQLYTRLRKLPKVEHVDLEVSSLNELVRSPSTQLREREALAAVRAALRGLAVEQQVLLELHYWHELDAAALAEVFAATPGAIRVRLLRARKALRARLEGGEPGRAAADDGLSRALREPEPEDGV
jgi:RNA polymerase sigma factor (sigma-70 family)